MPRDRYNDLAIRPPKSLLHRNSHPIPPRSSLPRQHFNPLPRKNNGNYTSIFDLTKRVDLRSANKKAFDGLAMAGGLDSFKNVHRAQYYQLDEKGITFIERAIRYGNK